MHKGNYIFIYDEFLSDKKYERLLSNVEQRLATLDIQGRIGRLTLFRNPKDLVEGMIKGQVGSTVVIVGNDRTLERVMWFLPDLDVIVGYIPMCAPQDMGKLLGISQGVEACDVLGARSIEILDIGKLDDRYFLTEVCLPRTSAVVEIEGKYRVSAKFGGSISIRNLGNVSSGALGLSDAKDGLLEVVIKPQTNSKSRFWNRGEMPETRILMRGGSILSQEPVDVLADNFSVNGKKFQLDILKARLRVITGRRRLVSAGSGSTGGLKPIDVHGTLSK